MVIVVEIEDQSSPKPFLGGWRDVARNIEYHDATSQTLSLKELVQSQRKLISVPVQTVESFILSIRSRSVGVGGIDRSIQTNGLFPEIGDVVVDIREIRELFRRRRDAAIKIQRFFRAHRNRQFVDDDEDEDDDDDDVNDESCSSVKLFDVYGDDNDNDLDEYRLASLTSSPDYHCQYESIGEFHIVQPSDARPRDAADFAVLRNLLDRWSIAEEARIRASCQGESKIVAQTRRLEREIEILRAIESSRSEISRKRAERVRGKFLDELSRPIDIQVSCSTNQKDNIVHIETLNVQYAREFRDLFDALMAEEDDENFKFDFNDRIELLFTLKKMAMQHTCATSRDLENVIDQELYLISLRVNPSLTKHLRSRVRLAFLRLARRALQCQNKSKGSTRTQLCTSCRRLKKLEAFETDHRERISRTCIDCSALRARRRESEVCLEIYERMLRELRRNEAARPDGSSSLAFVMGPKSIRYLVNNIWHGRSVISECDDLEQLRLVRLNPRVPWSPWNTLLTTRREARMHDALASASVAFQAYDTQLIRKFSKMNLQARLYFKEMSKLSSDNIISL